MNTTNAAVTAGALTVLGRWSEGDSLSVRIVVGVVTLALMLSVLPEKVGRPFAWLIVFAVLFRYGTSIVEATGLAGPPRQKIVKGHTFTREGRRA